MDPVLECQDLKEEIKGLKKELEEVKSDLVRCDAMLGVYVERLKTTTAQLIWYEVEANLKKED